MGRIAMQAPGVWLATRPKGTPRGSRAAPSPPKVCSATRKSRSEGRDDSLRDDEPFS